MSAERLRQAATLLRERAEAATPGPWEVSGTGSFICADHPQIARSARVVAKADDEWIDHRCNAAYIALMAPPVALALADWLEDHAINADYWAQELAANPDSDPMRFVAGDSADRLADAILGDAS